MPQAGSRYEKIGAMPGLGGRRSNRSAARNALVGREVGPMFDGVHQQIKCPLSVWLNQLELLREAVFVRLDVVAVLHLVEPVCRMPPALMVPLLAPLGKSS